MSKHQIICGGNYFNLPPTRCIICWDKLQPWTNFSQWELLWTSYDMPAKMYRISNRGGSNKKEKIHPTEKPEELYRKIYHDFKIGPGMKVLDTHLGSGNHRIAAYKAGVDFTGIEIDETYFNLQEQQFEIFLNKFNESPKFNI